MGLRMGLGISCGIDHQSKEQHPVEGSCENNEEFADYVRVL